MSEHALTAEHKQAIARRARGCCEYCQSQARFSPDPFSVEHIVPRSRGGTDEGANLALACQGCNNRKYTSVEAPDPVSGETVSLYHPRQQRWDEHFSWNEDYTLVLGMTPTGRATVEKLQLNRAGIVNLRRVLHRVSAHPPAELEEP